MIDPERRFRLSLAGRVTAVFLLVVILASVLAVWMSGLGLGSVLTVCITLLIALPLGTWMMVRVLRPLDTTLDGLADGIRGFSDRDFSLRLNSERADELGDLARLYNEVGRVLSEERQAMRQRELLLQTALDRSPVAILLVNPVDRVVFSNSEARDLLVGGASLVGRRLAELRESCPLPMREIMQSETDGVFTIGDGDRVETYHLSQRRFRLNRQEHTLLLLHRMTHELGRQEAQTWKKVIRVISHELNNSLAPVSSLVHSAQLISREPQHAGRADEVFDAIKERLEHLNRFISGYARFARLPLPRKQEESWHDLLAGLGEFPGVELEGAPPPSPGYFDRAQIQQLLVNLLKNATEASAGEPEVSLCIRVSPDGGTYLQVLDRGRGMDEQTMTRALLPFYSTKAAGSGLGLPLCREIVEAHGGKISLQAREGGGTVVTCWLPPR